jgi:hypothetical protein
MAAKDSRHARRARHRDLSLDLGGDDDATGDAFGSARALDPAREIVAGRRRGLVDVTT